MKYIPVTRDHRRGKWSEARRKAHGLAMHLAFLHHPWKTGNSEPWDDERKAKLSSRMKAFWTPEKRAQASRSGLGIKQGPRVKH